MSSCLERMLGSVRAQQIRSQWNQISTEFEQFVVGVLASELWTRSELDLPTRSLVTIAGLTALGKPRALALNIEMALNNGASRQEIRETVLQMAFYAASRLLGRVFKQQTKSFESCKVRAMQSHEAVK